MWRNSVQACIPNIFSDCESVLLSTTYYLYILYSFKYFIFIFSKHAKRHPNFNTNALRQRRGNLGESPLDGATRVKVMTKAESVNSSEDTPSEDLPSDKMSDSLPSP